MEALDLTGFTRFLDDRLMSRRLVTPSSKPPRNPCRRRHIVILTGGNDFHNSRSAAESLAPMSTPTISRVLASQANPIQCLLPLLSTNDHNSSH
jgi:hypothetical protein